MIANAPVFFATTPVHRRIHDREGTPVFRDPGARRGSRFRNRVAVGNDPSSPPERRSRDGQRPRADSCEIFGRRAAAKAIAM